MFKQKRKTQKRQQQEIKNKIEHKLDQFSKLFVPLSKLCK